MKRLPIAFTLVFLTFFAGVRSTAAAGTTWPHEQSDIRPDPAVTWNRLPNGVRYAIMKHADPSEPASPSRRTSLRLYVQVGSLMERDDQQGLAHFLEHMAFRGTKHFSSGEIVKYFQRLGMGFVSDTNAETGFDRTLYKLELPENSDAYLDDGLTLFRDFADGMLLDDKDVDKERGVVLNEKLAGDSVDYRGLVDRLKFVLPKARVPKRMPIGTEEVIRGATRQRLEEFYRKWYTPERMVVVVVGPIDAARVAAKIAAKFGSMKCAAEAATPDLGSAAAGAGLRARLSAEPKASAATIVMENWRPNDGQVETARSRRDDLLQAMAGLMLNRRLEKLAGGPQPRFIGAAAGSEVLLRALEGRRLSIICKPEQWQTALSAGEQELRRAIQFGFADGEFSEVKEIFTQSMIRFARQSDSRLSADLANGIVTSVAAGQVVSHPQEDLRVFNAMIATVTAADCAESLRRGWGSPDLSIFVHGNLKIENGEAAIKAAYLKSRSVALERPQADKKLAWSYTDFGRPGAIVQHREVKDLGLTLVKFANNVRLNMKPTTLEKDAIYVTVSFGGGKLAVRKDKPGLALFANRRFIGGGLEKYSLEEINRLIVNKISQASFDVGDEFFTLKGATRREDLEFQMQLLCAYLTAPGFRGDREAVDAQRVDSLYLEARNEVGTAIACELPRLLFGDDYRLAFPRKEEYKTRTMAELKDWLAEARRASWLEIGVVGDFEPQAAIEATAATFGALPRRADARPDYSDERRIALVKPPCEKRIDVDSPTSAAAVVVAWPTTDARPDVKLARQCTVLSNILGDRLRVKVREELGKTYTPSATVDMSDTFTGDGAILGQLTCEAAQAPQIGQIVVRLAAELAAGGATADELRRAKQPLLTAIDRQRRDNSWWMEQLVEGAQSWPQRLDRVRSRQADYEGVSLEAVNRLAQTYLARERAIVILAGPQLSAKQTAAR